MNNVLLLVDIARENLLDMGKYVLGDDFFGRGRLLKLMKEVSQEAKNAKSLLLAKLARMALAEEFVQYGSVNQCLDCCVYITGISQVLESSSNLLTHEGFYTRTYLGSLVVLINLVVLIEFDIRGLVFFRVLHLSYGFYLFYLIKNYKKSSSNSLFRSINYTV